MQLGLDACWFMTKYFNTYISYIYNHKERELKEYAQNKKTSRN